MTAKFPNDLLLVQFLRSAKRCAGQGPYIHDAFGFDKSYNEFLGDILRMRGVIRDKLPASVFNERGILREEAPYVAVLTKSGYEFLVAFFVTRVLGGACIPFGSGILPEEARYFIESAKSPCLLAGRGCTERAEEVVSLVKQRSSLETVTLSISCDAEPLEDVEIGIDESLYMAPEGPGLAIFTSGTTAAPKGAVLPRRCIVFMPDAAPESQSVCFRPPHWLGGAISMIGPVLTGKKVHILKERAGVEEIWNVFLNNRITSVGFTPVVLREMKEFIESRSEEEQERYIRSFKNVGAIYCAGAMISPSVVRFWTTRTGLVFNNVYGSTEVGGFATQKMLDGREFTNSIGVAWPGIEVKLSEGDHGEICVKSPFMASHYIGDEEKTKAAFDEEGFFKTGDLAEFKDGEYLFSGRANSDYVFFHGFRIPTVQVETALTALPYISEACVLGVPDHEAKEICAAVVRLTRDAAEGQTTLAKMRSDLSEKLPTYMLPVLLRVLAPGEEMPQTASQKPIKKLIVKQCFGVEEYWSAENPAPGVEFCGNMLAQVEAETRPWDWCGLQRGDYEGSSK